MKSKSVKPARSSKELRQEILDAMVASFKIEGIHISNNTASSTLKKLETTLGK